jgi:hypothetical protein
LNSPAFTKAFKLLAVERMRQGKKNLTELALNDPEWNDYFERRKDRRFRD